MIFLITRQMALLEWSLEIIQLPILNQRSLFHPAPRRIFFSLGKSIFLLFPSPQKSNPIFASNSLHFIYLKTKISPFFLIQHTSSPSRKEKKFCEGEAGEVPFQFLQQLKYVCLFYLLGSPPVTKLILQNRYSVQGRWGTNGENHCNKVIPG